MSVDTEGRELLPALSYGTRGQSENGAGQGFRVGETSGSMVISRSASALRQLVSMLR